MDSASLVPEIEKKFLPWVWAFHCVRHNGRVFLRFRLGFLALGSGQMRHFLSQIFFAFLTRIRVFRALD